MYAVRQRPYEQVDSKKDDRIRRQREDRLNQVSALFRFKEEPQKKVKQLRCNHLAAEKVKNQRRGTAEIKQEKLFKAYCFVFALIRKKCFLVKQRFSSILRVAELVLISWKQGSIVDAFFAYHHLYGS